MTEEKLIWSGAPSQVINMWIYILCALLSPLIAPIFIGLWEWLKVRNEKYEITNQRFIHKSGVISKKVEETELYRIRDYTLRTPLLLRLFSLSNLILTTSDKTHPVVMIKAVSNAEKLRDIMRDYVERQKTARRVTEIDIE